MYSQEDAFWASPPRLQQDLLLLSRRFRGDRIPAAPRCARGSGSEGAGRSAGGEEEEEEEASASGLRGLPKRLGCPEAIVLRLRDPRDVASVGRTCRKLRRVAGEVPLGLGLGGGGPVSRRAGGPRIDP